MTSTSWFKLFGIGACAALAAAACTVSSGEGEDDDEITTGSGGSAGEGGSGGSGVTNTVGTTSNTTSTSSSTSSTTGTTSGTTSTTGSGGAADDIECLRDENEDFDDVALCEVPDSADCCSKCIVTNCCDGYSKCYASPANICGGTEEGYETDSEIYAFQSCMLNVEDGALAGTEDGSDFANCIDETFETVSAEVCGNGTISGPANELTFCMAGGDEGIDGCFAECLDNTFDEDTCTY